MPNHGWLASGGRLVGPGDWIITHENGEVDAITNTEFVDTYEAVP